MDKINRLSVCCWPPKFPQRYVSQIFLRQLLLKLSTCLLRVGQRRSMWLLGRLRLTALPVMSRTYGHSVSQDFLSLAYQLDSRSERRTMARTKSVDVYRRDGADAVASLMRERGMEIPVPINGEPVGAAVVAVVNHGRWIAECECNSAQLLDPDD